MCIFIREELNQNLTSGSSWLPKVSHLLDAAAGVSFVPTCALNMWRSAGQPGASAVREHVRKLAVTICSQRTISGHWAKHIGTISSFNSHGKLSGKYYSHFIVKKAWLKTPPHRPKEMSRKPQKLAAGGLSQFLVAAFLKVPRNR